MAEDDVQLGVSIEGASRDEAQGGKGRFDAPSPRERRQREIDYWTKSEYAAVRTAFGGIWG